MKAEIAVSGMRSTIQPHQARPVAMMMHPAISANADAMTFAGISGLVCLACRTTFPTTVDITATGYSRDQHLHTIESVTQHTPIVMSFNIAKNQ
jgi:hypothetical protein